MKEIYNSLESHRLFQEGKDFSREQKDQMTYYIESSIFSRR